MNPILLTLGNIPQEELQQLMLSFPASQRPPHEVIVTETDFGAILGTLFFEATVEAQPHTEGMMDIDRSKVGAAAIQEKSGLAMDQAKVVIVSEGIFITWCASNPDILAAEFPNAEVIFAALPGSNNLSFTRVK